VSGCVRKLAFAVAVAAIARTAPAGPPFLTDDPEPVAYQHWEVYLFSTYDRSPTATDASGPALELNFGAAPELQLHLVVPWAWHRSQGSPTRSGWGDVELGFKLRLLDESEGAPQVGIFPMAELPAGDASQGLGTGHLSFRLPVWAQKSWGPWTTYGGGGWVIDHADGKRDHAFAGWLLQRDLSAKVTLGGELFTEAADAAGGTASAVANLGGYVNLGPGFSLLFSGGRTFAGERHTVGYLGLYWTWGPRGH
jgi:hypothetical protein